MLTPSAAVLARALASTLSVPAEPPPTQPAPSVVVTHEWYGWQPLSVDGVALSLAGVGFAEEASTKQSQALLLTGFVAGAVVYAFGPPVVHFVHGRIGIGFADMGVRVSSALFGSLLAGGIAALGMGDPPTGSAVDVIVGLFAAGFLAPMVIDAAFLSSATVVHYPDRPPTISSSWSLAPFVSTARSVGETGNRSAVPVFGFGGSF